MEFKENDKVEFYVVDNMGKIRRKIGTIHFEAMVWVDNQGKEKYNLSQIYDYLAENTKELLGIKKTMERE